MRVFALCCASFIHSVRRASGVEPLLSPPVSLPTFTPELLQGYDFLYFKLHGLPGQPYWYGDRWLTTLSAKQLSQVDLQGAVVFVANCFLTESPMLAALFDAGASVVVGGAGENYAAKRKVFGADLLGMTFRQLLQARMPPALAFEAAKFRLSIPSRRDRFTRDTLDFRLYEPPSTQRRRDAEPPPSAPLRPRASALEKGATHD